MTTFERIKKLADNQKISLQKVAINIGLSENAIYGWKTRKPKGEDLAKVADYFHVSVDYLLGRDTTEPENQTVDLAELANKPKDFDWDSVLSVGGKPIPEEDKEIIRRLFAHKLSD
ncbi:Transcriptional regulator xre family [Lactococcus lactis subsp. lactis]|uniref:Transcriptional regulator xre family n=1 Tax=Lactococcus lactis subsp. lactis TaxID=1360 RepID=A0A0V8CGI6_LACLL|nr:XRE family transcriptional regulator [Lactococcus lactis]KSU00455.1 Transcriptional regulator xre family [Lactococcus lactis subsp. lactis]KSU14657.1 Transcriptional regulator xre family [Lactococcus lactis subsp. lactis]MBU7542906.1 helix-turn-helix domain-containing protein [Lactococcus lactis]